MSSSAKVSSESTGSRSAALETAPPELAWNVNGAKVLCAEEDPANSPRAVDSHVPPFSGIHHQNIAQ